MLSLRFNSMDLWPRRSTSRWGLSGLAPTPSTDLLQLHTDIPTLNKQWSDRSEMSRDLCEHASSVMQRPTCLENQKTPLWTRAIIQVCTVWLFQMLQHEDTFLILKNDCVNVCGMTCCHGDFNQSVCLRAGIFMWECSQFFCLADCLLLILHNLFIVILTLDNFESSGGRSTFT